MTERRIILFRAMNTGGVRAPVAEQRAMALDLGLGDPRTLLASGNLVVDSDRDPADLADAVEAETERRFGRRIEAIVRTPRQWAAMMKANPFPDQAASDGAKLLVMVMKDGLKPDALDALQPFAVEGERMAEAGGDLFFWFPDGMGRSKLAEKAQPRLIGTGSGRNWNTVLKIAELAGR